jgi:hypothetical protein
MTVLSANYSNYSIAAAGAEPLLQNPSPIGRGQGEGFVLSRDAPSPPTIVQRERETF